MASVRGLALERPERAMRACNNHVFSPPARRPAVAIPPCRNCPFVRAVEPLRYCLSMLQLSSVVSLRFYALQKPS